MQYESIKCLYYPYSRALSLTTLKRAVLLFDKIGFVDSQPAFIRHELMSHVIQDDEERANIESVYNFLQDEGVLEFIDPEDLLIQYDDLITANVITDISDDEYCEIAVHHSADEWRVLRSRIPPSFLKNFYPGAGTYLEAVSLQAIIQARGNRDLIADPQNRRFADLRWGDMSYEDALAYFRSSRYRYVIGGNPYIELEAYELPFLHASSLRTNEVLLLASLGDWVPFTDSCIHDKLLTRKVQVARQRTSQQPSIIHYFQSELPLDIPTNHLALALVDRLISDEDLSHRSFDDLLYYRRQNAEQLSRLREKLREFSSNVNLAKAEGEYYHDLQRLVDSKLAPEIRRIRDDLITKYEDAFGKITLRSAQITVPTLIASVLAGLSIPTILTACAVAELGMLGTSGMGETVKVWQTSRESKRSSFAYLLNFQ